MKVGGFPMETADTKARSQHPPSWAGRLGRCSATSEALSARGGAEGKVTSTEKVKAATIFLHQKVRMLREPQFSFQVRKASMKGLLGKARFKAYNEQNPRQNRLVTE